MKNAIEIYINQNGLDETVVMNRLQDIGMISDLAVNAKNVWSVDAERAVKFLRGDLL